MNITSFHLKRWLKMFQKHTNFGYPLLEKKGEAHKDNKVRTVHLPPYKSFSGWDISSYRDRWDLIEKVLNADQSNASEM